MTARWKYLLAFCIAVDPDAQTFVHKDQYGNKTYPELRIDGYAKAYLGNFVEKIVLFGPVHETEFITKQLILRGVADSDIESRDTHVSTIGNGNVMRQFMTTTDASAVNAIMSSSAYHIRAPYFGFENGVCLQFIPAEAFLFATANTSEKETIRRALIEEFGSGDFVSRFVAEICGIGDRLADRYVTPHIVEGAHV